MCSYISNYLLVSFVLFGLLWVPKSCFVVKPIESLHAFASSRGLFQASGSDVDHTVLNIVRIIIGLLLFARSVEIWNFYSLLPSFHSILWVLVTYMFLIALLTVGFVTPVTSLFLLLFQLYFNFELGTYTLGIDVVAMILLIFVLYPAGKILSLDASLAYKYSFRRFIDFLVIQISIYNHHLRSSLR